MNFGPSAPPPPPPLAPDPALEQAKKQAEDDRVSALQERVSTRTNDLLLRYGGRAAFGGAGRAT